jgi:hypothetical protein
MGIFTYSPLVQRLEGKIGHIVFENSSDAFISGVDYRTRYPNSGEAPYSYVFRTCRLGGGVPNTLGWVLVFFMIVVTAIHKWEEERQIYSNTSIRVKVKN